MPATLSTRLPAASSTTSSVLLPSAATKSRLPLGSIAKWSKRPVTPGNGMVETSFKGSKSAPWLVRGDAPSKIRTSHFAGPVELRSGSFLVLIVVPFFPLSCFARCLVRIVHIGLAHPAFRPIGEIVKQSGAVSLRPNPDFASFFESIVLPAKGFFAVERDNEIVVLEVNAQEMPLV